MSNIILTSGLCKRYGQVMRVKDLDLAAPEGSVYGFLGPNGAGKSTTLKMILGLVRPTAGTIQVGGKTMNQHNRLEILREIGALIEAPSYYGHLTGLENMRIVQTLKDAPVSHIEHALQVVRLENQKNKPVNQYSLGMKQRLALAFALLGDPKILILDEPTNGLDPAGIQEIRELIVSLPRQRGITVLVSSHLLSEVDQMANTVGIISQGELVFQDSLDSLHQRSQRNIAIRVIDNNAAKLVLRDLGELYSFHEGYFILPDMKDEAVARCVALLAQKQVGPVRVEERAKSLEDIFLDLTGMAVSL
jgi:lantibiotic transport system ATP-binding protein